MSVITYFSEDISFTFPQKRKTSSWIKESILKEGLTLISLTFVFCSDEYLLQINRDYLNHDYFTDIITFSQSDTTEHIEGDIFISIDRVRDNSLSLNIEFMQELFRVMIHGVLHLCGYDDHTETERSNMRTKEDLYLSLKS